MKKIIALCALLASGQALANNCELTVEATDTMQFNAKELTVPASCKEVKLTLKHVGTLPVNVMGHNWVLTKTADVSGVANAGIAQGLDKNYLPANDDRILAATKVVGGGASTSISFDVSALKGQDLTFFCSFPGHSAIMKGKFVVS
ncbi:azurin [Endozoicomonas sp. G2_1]|uniref:azurin n=1 Tax=Endozoicomonas sp. G2_1 TaxID=2821091 RepID=UPI001ADC575F|nr:azurin [Endozoicomonas sp. G2_1]MBO9490118.1 azurin [Endozoicomonas sp. G2_1]